MASMMKISTLFISLTVISFFCLIGEVVSQEKTEPPKPQQRSGLDIIPSDASWAIYSPRIGTLGSKLRALSKAAFPNSIDLVSGQIQRFYREAGFDIRRPEVRKLLDRQRAGAHFYLSGSPFYVLPIVDADRTAEYFGIAPERFKKGSVLKINLRNFAKLMNGFVYLGSKNETDEQRGNKSDHFTPFSDRLSKVHQQRYANSDAVLIFDDHTAEKVLGTVSLFLDPSLGKPSDKNEDSDGFVKRMWSASSTFDFAAAGLEFDDGLGAQLTAYFDDENDKQLQELIKLVRGGEASSNLDCLPDQPFVAALAAKGTGNQNAAAAKSILKLLVNRISPDEEILSQKDKTVFYDSFTDIWKRLNGTRMGVYRITRPESKDSDTKDSDSTKAIPEANDQGELASVVIFDIEDPKGLLAQLPELVKFANESAERNSVKEDLLPIRFSYQSSVSTIGGHPVDVLLIDTDRISEEMRKRFQTLFGKEAKQIKLIPLKDHLLMLVGTDTALVMETIDNLATGKKGLAANKLITKSSERLDSRKKIEIHFSFENLREIYGFKTKLKPHVPVKEASCVGFTIDPDRIGVDAWVPAKELNPAIDWLMLLLWR